LWAVIVGGWFWLNFGSVPLLFCITANWADGEDVVSLFGLPFFVALCTFGGTYCSFPPDYRRWTTALVRPVVNAWWFRTVSVPLDVSVRV
jgi:hypothetical protein